MATERFVIPSILKMDIEQLRGLCNGLIGIATYPTPSGTLSDQVQANVKRVNNPLMRADIEYALKLLHEPAISRDMNAARREFLRG